MASVGKAHSCPLAQSPETQLQIMHIESENVDASIDDGAIDVQRPNVVVVGRGPTKLEVEHHVASGHMRECGIAGRHERLEPGREDEERLVAINGAEDDNDDDETTQNKLLILVAKDAKTGKYAATCLQEKRVSGYATSWLVSLLRRLGYRKAILQSDGEPSIVALKTATLLASSFVELVLRESPVGEHATKGVAESAMREVIRHTRTVKFAMDAHVGKIVESQFILKWIPTMAADAISSSRIGRVGFTAEMRRCGRAWKKLVAEFGESVNFRPVFRSLATAQQQESRQKGHHLPSSRVAVSTQVDYSCAVWISLFKLQTCSDIVAVKPTPSASPRRLRSAIELHHLRCPRDHE